MLLAMNVLLDQVEEWLLLHPSFLSLDHARRVAIVSFSSIRRL
jgi:hypothetical protein